MILNLFFVLLLIIENDLNLDVVFFKMLKIEELRGDDLLINVVLGMFVNIGFDCNSILRNIDVERGIIVEFDVMIVSW